MKWLVNVLFSVIVVKNGYFVRCFIILSINKVIYFLWINMLLVFFLDFIVKNIIILMIIIIWLDCNLVLLVWLKNYFDIFDM